MAEKDINLVPEEIRAQQVKKKRHRLLKIIGWSALIASVSITLAVYAFSFYLGNSIENTKQKIEREEAFIEARQGIENRVKRIQFKVEELSSLLEDRVYYSRLLEVMPEILPNSVGIRSLFVQEDVVRLTGNSLGTVDIAKLLEVAVEEGEGGEFFNRAELSSVSLQSTSGRSNFSLQLYLKEGVLRK